MSGSVVVGHPAPGLTMVEAVGPLGGATIEPALAAAAATADRIVVDLGACTSISGGAVEGLLRGWQRTTTRRVPFAIACPPARVPPQLLDLVRRGVFALYDTREDAVVAVKRSAATGRPHSA